MNNKQISEQTRVSIAIGFMGIILTIVYIIKEHYALEQGIIIKIIKMFIFGGAIYIGIYFSLFLVKLADELKYKGIDEKYKNVDDIGDNKNWKEFFYNNAIEGFSYFVHFAIASVLIKEVNLFVMNLTSLSLGWSMLITTIFYLEVYFLLYAVKKFIKISSERKRVGRGP